MTQNSAKIRYQQIRTGTWRGYDPWYVTQEYKGTVPRDLEPVPSADVQGYGTTEIGVGTWHKKYTQGYGTYF